MKKAKNYKNNDKVNIIRETSNPYRTISHEEIPYDKDSLLGNKILTDLKNETRVLKFQYERYKNDLHTIRVILV